MRLRQWILFLLLIVPGITGFVFCMYYALQDWAALQKAYIHFSQIASANNSFNAVFIAEAKQNIHRINLFADVVWALLSAIIAAIGIHGIFANHTK